MPQVTVLLPVYNGANYLAQAMQSVLAQDFIDFELHVLDDCSEDESARVAQSSGDPRVRYSRNPERYGLFKTLNRGFEEAKTSLVRIWAHDDIMLPGGLRAFVDFAQRHPSAGMVYSDFYAINAAGERTGDDLAHVGQRVRTPEIASPQVSALLFCCYGCLPGNISTVMLRKEIWAKVGGFLTGIQQAPDYEMWVRMSEHHNVGFIREKTVELRSHPLQLGQQGHRQMTSIEEELQVVRMLKQRLADIVPEAELRRVRQVERGRQYVQWIARAALRGDFAGACRGWKALAHHGQPWSQALFWLLSINGRFFMLDRNTWFDRHLALVNNSHAVVDRVLAQREMEKRRSPLV
jgi:hypothetical protein